MFNGILEKQELIVTAGWRRNAFPKAGGLASWTCDVPCCDSEPSVDFVDQVYDTPLSPRCSMFLDSHLFLDGPSRHDDTQDDC